MNQSTLIFAISAIVAVIAGSVFYAVWSLVERWLSRPASTRSEAKPESGEETDEDGVSDEEAK